MAQRKILRTSVNIDTSYLGVDYWSHHFSDMVAPTYLFLCLGDEKHDLAVLLLLDLLAIYPNNTALRHK